MNEILTKIIHKPFKCYIIKTWSSVMKNKTQTATYNVILIYY